MPATTKRTRKATAKTVEAVVTAPPASPLTLSDYAEDIRARWAIHTYERNAAMHDLQVLGKRTHDAVDAVVEYVTPHYHTVVTRLTK